MRIRRHFGRVPGSVPKIRPASLVRLVLERKRGRVSSLILDQAAERHIDQCRAQMVPGPVERIECRSKESYGPIRLGAICEGDQFECCFHCVRSQPLYGGATFDGCRPLIAARKGACCRKITMN